MHPRRGQMMRASLRHLRLLLALIETGSVTQAAAQLHVTQPAVSAALQGIETALGTALFDRRPRGLILTPAGAAVALRLRRALGVLDPALCDLNPQLKRTATLAQLTALIAVTECESFAAAARHLGLAQPSVHRALRQFEAAAGRSLFERSAKGMTASRAVRQLAIATRLALTELEQAEADVADLSGREVGRVVIGAMPLSRSLLLGPAIARFRGHWSALPIRITEGHYDDLAESLLRGEVDMLVGALRPPLPDFNQEILLQDAMAIVARPDHPLARITAPAVELTRWPWVVAGMGTPARDHFAAMFAAAQLPCPTRLVETGSMTLLCDVLGRTDHLGFVSVLQAQRDIANGRLLRLPYQTAQGTLRPIGLTTRRDWHPTRAQNDMIAALRAAVAEIASD